MTPRFSVEPLSDHHDLEWFDCGRVELTEWLQRHARHAVGQGTRTFVLVAGGERHAVGYFAIAPHLIQRDHLPRQLGHGAPRQVPAILLAKLALDTRLQGQGLGGELFVRALETVLEAARRAGGKLVVVDAIDDRATAFYQHHDFRPLPANPRRLVQKLSTAARALGVAWP